MKTRVYDSHFRSTVTRFADCHRNCPVRFRASVAVREFIVPFPMHTINRWRRSRRRRRKRRKRPLLPPDPRFDEMLELVLLTLRFPFRLGLPGYYRLSGRFVMTPEAAILVLSAAHYRRGMTVVAFIFFLPPSLLLSFALPPTLSFPSPLSRDRMANV